jgi:predicted transcriptional regulator of viral defense system
VFGLVANPSHRQFSTVAFPAGNAYTPLTGRNVRQLGYNPADMSDTAHDEIYQIAEQQAGYFTVGQAAAASMAMRTLRYHARPGGRFERVRRGLYRLRHFPSSPHEHVVAAWLPLRSTGAVVSHESALELYGLADVIPAAVHLSIPRAKRGVRPRSGVRIHTLEVPLESDEVRTVDGIAVTSPERTLVDALEVGSAPEQIDLAIRQAIDRGLTTPRRLREVVNGRPARTRVFIERATARVPA